MANMPLEYQATFDTVMPRREHADETDPLAIDDPESRSVLVRRGPRNLNVELDGAGFPLLWLELAMLLRDPPGNSDVEKY